MDVIQKQKGHFGKEGEKQLGGRSGQEKKANGWGRIKSVQETHLTAGGGGVDPNIVPT